MPPDTCPNCGAEVPSNARACPDCGACEKTGWSEEAAGDRLGLPDDSFNYDEFVKQEFGPKRNVTQGVRWFWAIISLALVVLFVWLALR